MNPNFRKYPGDNQKIRSEYLSNLALQVSNLQRTTNAVQLMEQTGQPPALTTPLDTTTLNQQAENFTKARVDLRSQLMSVTDGA